MKRRPPGAVLSAVLVALASTLAAMPRAAAQDLPEPVHEPADVRQRADEILSDARYEPPERSITERVVDWLAERFGDLVSSLGGSGGSLGTALAWLLIGVAVAVIVLVLVRGGTFTPLVRAEQRQTNVMVELTRPPDEWRDEASRLEAEGRWADGLRCRYRALVGELVRRGAIADQAGRTAGEYVRDMGSSLPPAAPTFAAATELFEAVWYGGADTGAAEAARFAELDARTLSSAAEALR